MGKRYIDHKKQKRNDHVTSILYERVYSYCVFVFYVVELSTCALLHVSNRVFYFTAEGRRPQEIFRGLARKK